MGRGVGSGIFCSGGSCSGGWGSGRLCFSVGGGCCGCIGWSGCGLGDFGTGGVLGDLSVGIIRHISSAETACQNNSQQKNRA